MKVIRNLLVLTALFLITGCGTYRINTTEGLARVSGHDSPQVDKLTIICRSPVNLIVDISGNTRICEGGAGKIEHVYKFSPVFSSRHSNSYKNIPVTIFPDPANEEYGDVRGDARTWRVSRNRSSDAAWLVELINGRLRIDEAR